MKNTIFRAVTAVILPAIILLSFTSCTDGFPSSEKTVTVTDALGRTVTIPKHPERVAALIGSFADIWMLAGGTICATADDAWDDFGLELPDAVRIGGAHSPNFELLLSANPQLVIASASTASHVKMKDMLESVGISVIYFDVDNVYDYLKMLDVCTDITDRKDLYEQNGVAVINQIQAIKTTHENRQLTEKERTVLLLRISSGSIKTKGSHGTILGEMLADLGCINIADNDSSLLDTLSVESVIREEPYRIFVVTMGNDTEQAMNNLSRMLSENPAWGALDAVKQNRIHVMDRRLFNIKPNDKWADSYEKLSSILAENE